MAICWFIFVHYQKFLIISSSIRYSCPHVPYNFEALNRQQILQSVFIQLKNRKVRKAMRKLLAIFAFAFLASTQVAASCRFVLSGLDRYTCEVENVISRSPTDVIDLSGTHVGELTNDDVNRVTFSSSSIIEEIPTMLFDTFPNMDSLTVQSQLMRLNLENCGARVAAISLVGNGLLWYLQSGAFEGCQSLQVVTIIGSPLQVIDEDVFTDLPNLELLVISGADLTYVGNWFQNNPNIYSIQLSNNAIRSIHPNAFQNLTSLEVLFLASNNLQQIDAGTFTNLPMLPNLSLRFNSIHTIEAGAFGNMPNLQTLQLANNYITSLDSNTFGTPMPLLNGLTLNDNLINAIGRNFFEPLINSSIRSVAFNNNVCVDQVVFIDELLPALENCFINSD